MATKAKDATCDIFDIDIGEDPCMLGYKPDVPAAQVWWPRGFHPH